MRTDALVQRTLERNRKLLEQAKQLEVELNLPSRQVKKAGPAEKARVPSRKIESGPSTQPVPYVENSLNAIDEEKSLDPAPQVVEDVEGEQQNEQNEEEIDLDGEKLFNDPDFGSESKHIPQWALDEVTREVDLSYYNLGNEGLRALLPSLEAYHFSTVEKLSVAGNNLSN